jgi:23S rRNA pseudouridine2605 synthase
VRLNRFLSQCGLGSRRGCEQIILEGRVSINGKAVIELGTVVSPEDSVTVDGKPTRAETPIVIALNKPKGYICSRADERDRMTIYALLPRQLQTLHHVGRLDKESEGLLLMTNRGDLSHHLIHPSKGAEKEYEVIVDKPMDQAMMAKLVHGMLTEEGHARAERAWMITEYRCHVVLKQGLKRQIRLMFYQLGFEVERLTRTRIGWLEVKGLPKGGWKQLTEAEVQRFFTEAGTTGKPVSDDKPRKKLAARKTDGEDGAFTRRLPARRPVKGTGSKPTGRARYALPRSESSEQASGRQRRSQSGPPRRGYEDRHDESAERSESPRRHSAPQGRSGPKRRGDGSDREDFSKRSGPPRRSAFGDRSGSPSRETPRKPHGKGPKKRP